MRRKFHIYLTIVIAVYFYVCLAAADIYMPNEDVETSFANAITDESLIDTISIRKTADSVKKFNDESVAEDGEVRLINGLSSLKEIVFYARQKLVPVVKLEADLLESIESVWRQLSGSRPHDDLSNPENWRIDENDFKVNLISDKLVLDFKATYLDKVPSSPDIYRNAIDTVGILVLMHRTLEYITRKPALEKIGSIARERMAQWQVYFNESIPQWPWELAWVNGPLYKHRLKCDKGLGTVPDWQLIVIHPDLAMEYIDGTADGDQLKPSLMVEIVGVDFWSWKKGAIQKGPCGYPVPLGVGLVATFADRADADDWGFGGVIHVNHIYNIGLTFRDVDTGFFVSVNLAKLFEDKSKKAGKYLDMVGL